MLQQAQGGPGYAGWGQHAYMVDQLANQHRGYDPRAGNYRADGGHYEHYMQPEDQMFMPHGRFPKDYLLPDQRSTSSSKRSTKKSTKKSKSESSRLTITSEAGDLLNLDRLYQIKGIKDDVTQLERDLAFIFKGYMKVVPFYKLSKLPKGIEGGATKPSRPPTPIESSVKSKPPEPKKTNKYIQNYLQKYEPEAVDAVSDMGDPFGLRPEKELASTMPKPSKPQTKPAKPKREKSVKDLYKAQGSHDDALSFDGHDRHRDQFNQGTTEHDTIGFDSNMHSLRGSEVSRVSSGSNRRESFENFRRQYFADTSMKQQPAIATTVAKKFTR